jgi:flagellar protein FliS
VSATLSRLSAGARARVLNASLGADPAPFRAVADDLDEIAAAWRTARGG